MLSIVRKSREGDGKVRVFLCWVGVTILCRMAREGLPEEPSPKGHEKATHVDFIPDAMSAVTVRRRACGSYTGLQPRMTEMGVGRRERLWEEALGR